MGKEFYGKPVMEVIEIEDDAIRTSGGQEVCQDTGCAPVGVCSDGGCAPVAVCSDCFMDGNDSPMMSGASGSILSC